MPSSSPQATGPQSRLNRDVARALAEWWEDERRFTMRVALLMAAEVPRSEWVARIGPEATPKRIKAAVERLELVAHKLLQ